MNKLERVLRDIQGIDDETAKGAAQVLTRAGFVDVDDVTDDDLDANPEQPHKFVAGEECRVCNRWSNNRLHIGSPMHRALTEVSP